MRGLIPNYTFMCLRAIYIYPTVGLPILLQKNMLDRSWEYINRSQTHACENWDCGRAIPFLGIHKWVFRYSAARNEMDAESVEMLREITSCWVL